MFFQSKLCKNSQKALLIAVILILGLVTAGMGQWDNRFTYPSFDNSVTAIAFHDNMVYLAGDFQTTGSFLAKNVVGYNLQTNTWDDLGKPRFEHGQYSVASINDMVKIGDYLYVGGAFDSLNSQYALGIASYHIPTRTWSTLPGLPVSSSFGNSNSQLQVIDNQIYVSGSASRSITQNQSTVARFNPASGTWTPIPINSHVSGFTRMKAVGNELFFLGRFSNPNSTGFVSVISYKPSDESWKVYPGLVISTTGINRHIDDVTRIGDTLVVAGRFSVGGDALAAKFDPTANGWVRMPVPNVSLQSVTVGRRVFVYKGELYLLGDITNGNLFRWNGFEFIPAEVNFGETLNLPGGETYTPQISNITNTRAYYADNERLVVYGGFNVNYNRAEAGVFRGIQPMVHDQNGLRAMMPHLGRGISRRTFDAVEFDGKLFVAVGSDGLWHQFLTADGLYSVPLIAWDGSKWEDVSEGVSNLQFSVLQMSTVKALVTDGTHLFAGGTFSPQGTLTKNIARYDKESGAWSGLSHGLDGVIETMAIHNGKLYIGGQFNEQHGQSTKGLIAWDIDAETWEYFDFPETNFWVRKIVAHDGKLYMSGQFYSPDVEGTGNFLVLNLSDNTFSNYDNLGFEVNQLTVGPDGHIYSGTSYYDDEYNYITGPARWTGSAWESVGALGFYGYTLRSMGWYNGKLYVAIENLSEESITINDVEVSSFAVWDPADNSWSSVGDLHFSAYTENPLHFRATSSMGLFILGNIWGVNEIASHGIANFQGGSVSIPRNSDSYADSPEMISLVRTYPNPFNPTTTISFRLREASDVTIEVYTVTGQRVATLYQGQMASGQHTQVFDAARLASGLYFIRIATPGQASVQKVSLIK